MNKNFLFVTYMIAIAANIAIIGCNRQGSEKETPKQDTVQATTTAENTPPPSMTLDAPASNNATPVIDANPPKATATAQQKNPYEKAQIEIKTFKVDPPGKGWGYDVLIDKKTYLHQPNIPAVPGNDGFSSEAYAHKAAELVVTKIRKNIMPPSIDPKELDSLGVLK